MSVAIVTGASSGLGKEFINAIIREMPEINNIWLIARRKERLEEIAQKNHDIKFKILPFDLSEEENLNSLKEILILEKPNIKLLINNAGIVGSGEFKELDLNRQKMMIALNSTAPTILTYMTLPYMKKGSMIVNVCSVAGFVPTPNMIVYSSTKAYTFNFTKGLRVELKKSGINVLALCPGNMRTEMFSAPTNPSEHESIVNLLPFLNIEKVAQKALRLSQRKRGVYTPHPFYKCYRLLAKIIPHGFMMKFSKV